MLGRAVLGKNAVIEMVALVDQYSLVGSRIHSAIIDSDIVMSLFDHVGLQMTDDPGTRLEGTDNAPRPNQPCHGRTQPPHVPPNVKHHGPRAAKILEGK